MSFKGMSGIYQLVTPSMGDKTQNDIMIGMGQMPTIMAKEMPNQMPKQMGEAIQKRAWNSGPIGSRQEEAAPKPRGGKQKRWKA